jgi:hypothetical protein
MSKKQVIRVTSMAAAVFTAISLALAGDYVEAVGVVSAAFSSASILFEGS